MSEKGIVRATAIVLAAALIFTTVFLLYPQALGIGDGSHGLAYAEAIFDPYEMMTVEITIGEDTWENLLANAQAKEYVSADISINGNKVTNVGIRCKGNSSLRTSSDTQRYSFKIQFDEYISGQTMLGLDKMVLNNTHSDNTWMKEYMAYYTMGLVGVNVPLFAFAKIYVNGEYWGLYLGIEALEDSYALRTYGSGHGHLYKVESMDMGNTESRANEMMDMVRQMPAQTQAQDGTAGEGDTGAGASMPPGDTAQGEMPQGEMPQMPEGMPEGFPGGDWQMPEGLEGFEGFEGFPAFFGENADAEAGGDEAAGAGQQARRAGGMGGFGGMFGGSAGGADLAYIDDDIDSYSSIFTKTVLDRTAKKDKQRVIAALKGISDEESNIEDYVDVDQMLRYIAGNAAVGNGDGYFGSMLHNYYLYEKNGKITMLPWDYNLSYGGFMTSTDATINLSIDEPFMNASMEDRPIVNRLLTEEEYLPVYYEYIQQIATFYTSGEAQALMDQLDEMIRPWVDADPTKVYTIEEYDAGVASLKEYLALRGESMQRQLDGDDTPVDTSSLNTTSMGSMMGGGGQRGNMGGGGGFAGFGGFGNNAQAGQQAADLAEGEQRRIYGWQGDAQTEGRMGATTPVSSDTYWLLGGCAAALVLALLFAVRFRRRRYT